jgi:hypothetical protein
MHSRVLARKELFFSREFVRGVCVCVLLCPRATWLLLVRLVCSARPCSRLGASILLIRRGRARGRWAGKLPPRRCTQTLHFLRLRLPLPRRLRLRWQLLLRRGRHRTTFTKFTPQKLRAQSLRAQVQVGTLLRAFVSSPQRPTRTRGRARGPTPSATAPARWACVFELSCACGMWCEEVRK